MFDRVLGHWTVQVAAVCSIVLLGILSLMPKVARTALETGFSGYLEHGAAYLFTGALVQLAFARANRWVISGRGSKRPISTMLIRRPMRSLPPGHSVVTIV